MVVLVPRGPSDDKTVSNLAEVRARQGKVSAIATRGDYERAGMGPFKPYPDRGGTMQYYAVPLDVLESAAALAEWARRAIDVARRAAR